MVDLSWPRIEMLSKLTQYLNLVGRFEKLKGRPATRMSFKIAKVRSQQEKPMDTFTASATNVIATDCTMKR